jgi:hypothetical protein
VGQFSTGGVSFTPALTFTAFYKAWPNYKWDEHPQTITYDGIAKGEHFDFAIANLEAMPLKITFDEAGIVSDINHITTLDQLSIPLHRNDKTDSDLGNALEAAHFMSISGVTGQ